MNLFWTHLFTRNCVNNNLYGNRGTQKGRFQIGNILQRNESRIKRFIKDKFLMIRIAQLSKISISSKPIH